MRARLSGECIHAYTHEYFVGHDFALRSYSCLCVCHEIAKNPTSQTWHASRRNFLDVHNLIYIYTYIYIAYSIKSGCEWGSLESPYIHIHMHDYFLKREDIQLWLSRCRCLHTLMYMLNCAFVCLFAGSITRGCSDMFLTWVYMYLNAYIHTPNVKAIHIYICIYIYICICIYIYIAICCGREYTCIWIFFCAL
jgi:hypothetical protein